MRRHKKLTKRKLAFRLVGLVLVFLGLSLGLVFLLDDKASTISTVVCVVLVVVGLILTSSPQAWLNAIEGALLGGL